MADTVWEHFPKLCRASKDSRQSLMHNLEKCLKWIEGQGQFLFSEELHCISQF